MSIASDPFIEGRMYEKVVGGGFAETIVIHREKDGPWERVEDGLPKKEGNTVFSLQADPLRAGSFFEVNNRGIYESSNRWKSWRRLNLDWKESYQTLRVRELLVL